MNKYNPISTGESDLPNIVWLVNRVGGAGKTDSQQAQSGFGSFFTELICYHPVSSGETAAIRFTNCSDQNLAAELLPSIFVFQKL